MVFKMFYEWSICNTNRNLSITCELLIYSILVSGHFYLFTVFILENFGFMKFLFLLHSRNFFFPVPGYYEILLQQVELLIKYYAYLGLATELSTTNLCFIVLAFV